MGSEGGHRTYAERLIEAQSQRGRGQLLGKSGQQQELKGIASKGVRFEGQDSRFPWSLGPREVEPMLPGKVQMLGYWEVEGRAKV